VLYLAHCSFTEVAGPAGDPDVAGYFTYLVKADDPEAARERLRDEVNRARARTDLFERAVEIYLDDLIEVRRLPRRGVIARYQAHLGAERPAVFKSFPAGQPPGCDVHVPGEPDDAEDAEDNPPDDVAVEPFMTFGPKAGR
jgi:hypothetical protein